MNAMAKAKRMIFLVDSIRSCANVLQSSKTGIAFWDGVPKSHETQQRPTCHIRSSSYFRFDLFPSIILCLQTFFHMSSVRCCLFFFRVCCCHLVVAVVVFVAHPTFVSFIYSKHYIGSLNASRKCCFSFRLFLRLYRRDRRMMRCDTHGIFKHKTRQPLCIHTDMN